MRPTTRTATAVIAALLTAAAITACGDSNDDAAPETVVISSAPAFGTTTPNTGDPAEAEQAAKDAAVQKARDFYRVRVALERDHTLAIEELDAVAGNPVHDWWRSSIITRRSEGIRADGDLSVVRLDVTGAEIPANAGEAVVTLTSCLDIRDLHWLNADGSPRPVPPDRMDYESANLVVRNAAYPDPNGWRVTGETAPVACTP